MKKVFDRKLLFLCITFLVLQIFVISAQDANQDPTAPPPIGSLGKAPAEYVRDFFSNTNFSGESFQLYSAQILFLILVVLIVFALSDFIPFLESAHPFLRFSISFIIGVLSVMYLAPDEIYTALRGYEALGIVLTTIIPFVLLMVFSIRWNTRYPEYAFFSQIAWIAYFVAYFVKFGQEVFICLATPFAQWGTVGSSCKMGVFGFLFVILTGIFSIIMIFFGKRIANQYFRWRMKGLISKAQIRTQAERVGWIYTLERMKNANPEDADIYQQEINKLKKLKS